MGGIRMTDCYETFIPLLRPVRPAAASTATMATTATAAAEAATDFLTATGFRSRPPSERATERRRLSRFTEAISVSIPFVCRHRQADSRNFVQCRRKFCLFGSLEARDRRFGRATAPGCFAPFIFSFLARPPSISSGINKRLALLSGGGPGFKLPSHEVDLTRCAVLWRVIG